MDKDYTTYSADQLLNDDFFIQSELHPTEKSRAFWSDLQIKSAALSQEIENARLFLHTIKIDRNCSSLAAKDEHALWQRIELKNKETERKAKRKQFIRLAISTVASLLLLSAIGWYATLRPKDAETDYLAIIQANPAPDSTNEKVQLVLSNNEKLTIDGTETQLEYKKEGKVNVNSKQVDLSPKGNPAQAQEFNQLIVPVGRRSSITFADGTRLWVNSGSKVVYPVKFAKEKREIFVEGEIYLHVSRDEQKPFIVKTHQMDIKVLGTQFNVTAYENEANMQVVLVSGKVEVNLDKCKNVLAPNQMFSYDSKIHKGKITTVTSPVQVRVMEQKKPPIRMIAPGRVFRADEVDATHSPSFHQIEGMVIDKGITFSNLKGTLTQFVQKLFGKETKVKFRPHHFPFTEPSAEMDVSCFKCGGKGCRFCKGEGWIEILGCGMVHPRVLRMSGIDPEEYSGFAFGIGLERITLLKYEIDDMRLLYENDDRFLKQF